TVWEVQNLALAAGAVVTAATLRHESRGAHFRADFPEPNPALVGCHLSYGGDGCRDWRFSSLQAAGQVG
ncbi:MAG: Fumarate reductase flavoprotein C-term, partial [Thermomicrobiales bacterium]|nr:Fumarate reductase flavoprotein C-term [Thermomicrobiales bacterium]